MGITGWEPSVCKSNRLRVDILRLSFIKPYSIKFSKMIDNFHGVLNINRLFSNSIGSSVTNCRFSPIIDFEYAIQHFVNAYISSISSWSHTKLHTTKIRMFAYIATQIRHVYSISFDSSWLVLHTKSINSIHYM